MKTCNICDSQQRLYYLSKNSIQLYKCIDCGLIYADKNFSREGIKEYYSEDFFRGNEKKFGYLNYMEEDNCNKINFKKRRQEIERWVTKGKVLDVGCATGPFLDVLDGEWEKYGIEISDYACSLAREKYGDKIFNQDLLEINSLPKNYFDLITMWDVIDHLTDPLKNLLKVNYLLKKNGILALNAGDIESLFARMMGHRWYLLIPPTHLFFFKPKTISALLAKAGFEILKIKYSGKYVPLKLIFFRSTYIFKNPVFDYFRKLFSRNKIGEINIYFNFFDVMTIYARKINA